MAGLSGGQDLDLALGTRSQAAPHSTQSYNLQASAGHHAGAVWLGGVLYPFLCTVCLSLKDEDAHQQQAEPERPWVQCFPTTLSSP